MPFTSALPPVIDAVMTVGKKIAKLPPHHASGKRVLENWDPTRCQEVEKDAIRVAFSTLAITYIPEIEARGYDWKKLADLMKTKTVDSLNITCEGRVGYPNISSNANAQPKQTLNVNLDTRSTTLLDAWLLVEVIHLCGGTDLDAWAIKNWFFSIDRSSTGTYYYPLLDSEKTLMCAGSVAVPPYNWRAGKFTVWNNVQGQLYPSNRAAATANNPVPAGGDLIPMGDPQSGFWQWHC
jgi:hypothetical protein